MWIAKQDPATAGGAATAAARLEKTSKTLAALDEVAAKAKQPAISQPPSVEAQPAVYDDAALSPDLQ